jgi:hypothetical protein
MKTYALGISPAAIVNAKAQGIYMLNGRATRSVIVGAYGAIFPVNPETQRRVRTPD